MIVAVSGFARLTNEIEELAQLVENVADVNALFEVTKLPVDERM